MKPEIAVIDSLLVLVMDMMKDEAVFYTDWPTAPKKDDLLAVADNIRAIATSGSTGASAKVMDMFPNLEIVGVLGVGTDAVDLEHAKSRGIAVTNTPRVLANGVAELALALMFAVNREVVAADAYARSGAWAEKGNFRLSRDLLGKKLGIFGYGAIGSRTAALASAIGMEVAYSGPREKPDVAYPYYPTLRDLAEACDILTLTCPGGPATAKAVDRAVLDALGPDGVLINVSRGSVVDEDELIAALREKRIRAAGLDVFSDEPRVPDALKSMDNVTMLPHMGSATLETRMAMSGLVSDNLRAHFAGRELLTRVV